MPEPKPVARASGFLTARSFDGVPNWMMMAGAGIAIYVWWARRAARQDDSTSSGGCPGGTVDDGSGNCVPDTSSGVLPPSGAGGFTSDDTGADNALTNALNSFLGSDKPKPCAVTVCPPGYRKVRSGGKCHCQRKATKRQRRDVRTSWPSVKPLVHGRLAGRPYAAARYPVKLGG